MKIPFSFFTITALTTGTAIAIFFGVKTYGTSEETVLVEAKQKTDEKILIGTGSPGDPCTAEIYVSALPQMKKMGIDGWVAACKKDQAEAAAKQPQNTTHQKVAP